MTTFLSPVSPQYRSAVKINIGLEVLYKRQDGYHELNTLFVRLTDPADTFEVRPNDRFEFTCDDPTLSVGSDNLVVRAMDAYRSRIGAPELPPMKIHLLKHVPAGAGLGGGSGDAAVALSIYNDWNGKQLSRSELATVGRTVGADVPFFVHDTPAATASGIGDVLKQVHIALPPYVILVKPPGISVSTNEAYSGLRIKNDRLPTNFVEALNQQHWNAIANDFEESVFAKHPLLRTIKEGLMARGAVYSAMSGSGSTIFGLFSDPELAENAQTPYQEQGYYVYVTRITT